MSAEAAAVQNVSRETFGEDVEEDADVAIAEAAFARRTRERARKKSVGAVLADTVPAVFAAGSLRSEKKPFDTNGIGAPAVPIVFLHGFAQSAGAWDAIARRVSLQSQEGAAQAGAVYALDFVGHGQSDKSESVIPYSMGFTCNMLRAFLRFVQQENAGRAPVVVGYSMGGRIALAAICHALGFMPLSGYASLGDSSLDAGCTSAAVSSAVSAEAPFSISDENLSGVLNFSPETPAGASGLLFEPDLPLSALVLESAGLGPASEEERVAAAQANAHRACALRDEGIERFMDEWERLPLFATQRELPEEVRASLRAGRLANDAEALARTLEGTGAQHMPARPESLAALVALAGRGVPVRYLVGQRDEKYRKLAECLRGFAGDSASIESLVVPDAGHNIHLENPEWFSRWLLSFARAV